MLFLKIRGLTLVGNCLFSIFVHAYYATDSDKPWLGKHYHVILVLNIDNRQLSHIVNVKYIYLYLGKLVILILVSIPRRFKNIQAK